MAAHLNALLDMLFKPTDLLMAEMLEFVQATKQAWRQPFTACMHVRTGRADKANRSDTCHLMPVAGCNSTRAVCSLQRFDYLMESAALFRLLRHPVVEGVPALVPGRGADTQDKAGSRDDGGFVYVCSDDPDSAALLQEATQLSPKLAREGFTFLQVWRHTVLCGWMGSVADLRAPHRTS